MTNLIPIRLLYSIKASWYKAYGSFESLKEGDCVIIKTSSGKMFGQVSGSMITCEKDDRYKKLQGEGSLDSHASEEDIVHADDLFSRSKESLPIFRKLVKKNNLDMNPISVEYLFDRNKAICYYDSEIRVDYRELVHDLSTELKAQIEMKQIGVRDGARMIGGLGHCGQELCCSRIFCAFKPVTIKMAKVQKLSLNPAKISGMCGRLMCCLRYEYEAYEEFYERAPKKNTVVMTPDGEGRIVDFDVLKESIHITVEDKKPVVVPLDSLTKMKKTKDKNMLEVNRQVWEEKTNTNLLDLDTAVSSFSSQLDDEGTVNDDPQKVTHHKRRKNNPKKKNDGGSKSQPCKRRSRTKAQDQSSYDRKRTRRRSTSINNDEEKKNAPAFSLKSEKKEGKQRHRRKKSNAQSSQKSNKQTGSNSQSHSKVGRRSSGLRKRIQHDTEKKS